VEPPFAVEVLAVLVGTVDVAHHDVAAEHADLALALLIAVGKSESTMSQSCDHDFRGKNGVFLESMVLLFFLPCIPNSSNTSQNRQ
jgi:hypothetical protein